MAIGSDVYKPNGEIGYGKYANVVTNQELESIMHDSEGKISIKGKEPKTVVFIQCVGSRNPEKNPGCSRFCCPTTIKQAIRLRENGINVVVLHRDMRTVGALAEEQYRHARALGVKFLRYTPERQPKIIGENSKAEKVDILELALNQTLEIDPDYIVLAAGMIPDEESTSKLQNILKVPRAADGFFMQRHAKLGPVETTTEGVFVAGCAAGPKDISDSIAQGAAAASRAVSIISRDTIALDPAVCVVDKSLCRGCGQCVDICDYHAPAIEISSSGIETAKINPALCKGCGTCASWCPTGAIASMHFTDKQINSMMDALLAG